MKKLISLLLSATFVVSALSISPASTSATEETTETTVEVSSDATDSTTDDLETKISSARKLIYNFVKTGWTEENEIYKYCLHCLAGDSSVKVILLDEPDGESSAVVAKIKEFMEENDIDEDLVTFYSYDVYIEDRFADSTLDTELVDVYKKLWKYILQSKAEDPEKYRWYSGCSIASLEGEIWVDFYCTVTEGENTIPIAEIKNFMKKMT